MDIIKIESNKQLFIDSRFIERSDNVTFAVNPPVKAGPIDLDIQPGGLISIVEHTGQYYMYFRNQEGFCVALSEDGLRWKTVRPSAFGSAEPLAQQSAFGKGRDLPLPGVSAGSVFVDPKDSTYPFKGIFAIRGAEPWGLDTRKAGDVAHVGMTQAAERGGLYLFRSRDGLKWDLAPGLPVPFLCDTHNQVFYDARCGHYVAFLRAFPRLGGPNRNKRCVARTEMTDLLQMPWPHKPNSHNKPEADYDYPYIQDEMPIVMAADNDDPPRTDLYNPCVHLYPYAEDVYVAFPSMYRNFDHIPSHGRDLRGTGSNTGLFETHLAISRDGHFFQRFREPYARSGFIRDCKGFEGELDCGMIMMGIGMIRSGDRLFQYYYGTGRLHGGASLAKENAFPGSAVFRAVQRLDGFVSLDTDHAGGEILTPKLKFAGNRLCLNADCAGLGEIWVEIQDAGNTAFPGYSMDDAVSIDRNGTAQEIWWKNGPDVSALAGKPVRLHIKMRSAKLYAFQFT